VIDVKKKVKVISGRGKSQKKPPARAVREVFSGNRINSFSITGTDH
jgi:hypothetical protein